MDNAGSSALNQALDRLWTQFLPQMQERLAKLEVAAQAIASGTLSDDMRAEAHDAAHKLAGVLGTFGLTRGTILAREAEIVFSGDPGPDPSLGAHLIVIAEQLKAMIASRQ
jgi:HPt (histidine-containing phosphotransfer) domain-containing protein